MATIMAYAITGFIACVLVGVPCYALWVGIEWLINKNKKIKDFIDKIA